MELTQIATKCRFEARRYRARAQVQGNPRAQAEYQQVAQEWEDAAETLEEKAETEAPVSVAAWAAEQREGEAASDGLRGDREELT